MVCASSEKVLTRAVYDRVSMPSEPSSLYFQIRAAVVVTGPIPSPRKKITFFASPAAKAPCGASAAQSATAIRVCLKFMLFMSC